MSNEHTLAGALTRTPPREIQTDDRPTFVVSVERVDGKIALEEHIESPDFPYESMQEAADRLDNCSISEQRSREDWPAERG